MNKLRSSGESYSISWESIAKQPTEICDIQICFHSLADCPATRPFEIKHNNPLVICDIAIENGRRNSEFSQ